MLSPPFFPRDSTLIENHSIMLKMLNNSRKRIYMLRKFLSCFRQTISYMNFLHQLFKAFLGLQTAPKTRGVGNLNSIHTHARPAVAGCGGGGEEVCVWSKQVSADPFVTSLLHSPAAYWPHLTGH